MTLTPTNQRLDPCFKVGTYLQLAVLWSCGHFLGVANVPGAILFFELTGWLSILEHDKYVRVPAWVLILDSHTKHINPYSTVVPCHLLQVRAVSAF